MHMQSSRGVRVRIATGLRATNTSSPPQPACRATATTPPLGHHAHTGRPDSGPGMCSSTRMLFFLVAFAIPCPPSLVASQPVSRPSLNQSITPSLPV
ncbi:unnamed protein product [Vitrella brassicaformis CCMP3155]|uniref:Uncharacterized protein n=1 Tax=Vitrella brassicaformis (strain CCMP3155) TaxID=1169540 RepID=A0A0G4GQF5_VITBC|nr:unnamed protein product [Vitrella brassicaformis CCMP3155]|eukprot:CEM32675.1 unnamed protein product [Vitrella brassicaformis CCMP3155]